MLNKRKESSFWEELPKEELYFVQGGENKMFNLLSEIKEFIGNLFDGNKENNN